MRLPHLLFIASLFLVCAVPIHAAEPVYHVISKDILPGDVKWDYFTYDVGSKRLFITRGDQVDVYDPALGRVVASIADTPGVHGVALASDINKGFTSNGRSNTVTVFELSSSKVLGTLPTGKKPDAIVYDPFTRRVFVANGESGSLTVIDAARSEVLATVVVGGKLEFAAVNGKGRLYVNVENKNTLAVVDTVKLSVVARYDLSASCEEPTGLAIDSAAERLFVGCHNQTMAVVSGRTGEILATVPIGKGCDATAYDSELKLAFSSNGEGTLTIISADTYAVRHARTTEITMVEGKAIATGVSPGLCINPPITRNLFTHRRRFTMTRSRRRASTYSYRSIFASREILCVDRLALETASAGGFTIAEYAGGLLWVLAVNCLTFMIGDSP